MKCWLYFSVTAAVDSQEHGCIRWCQKFSRETNALIQEELTGSSIHAARANLEMVQWLALMD